MTAQKGKNLASPEAIPGNNPTKTMEILKKITKRSYTEFVFISGEIVVIYSDMFYNYEDTARADTWQSGWAKVWEGKADLGPLKPPSAVKAAFESMGYRVIR